MFTKKKETEIENVVKKYNAEVTIRAMQVVRCSQTLIKLGLMRKSKTYVKHGVRYFKFSKKELTALIATALLGDKIKD